MNCGKRKIRKFGISPSSSAPQDRPVLLANEAAID
jgi:hypothetical protein